MSSERWRYSLDVVERLAHEIVELLEPATTRCEIVGSIRRRAPFVGDIELLVEPAYEPAQFDLCGRATRTRNVLNALVDELVASKTFERRLDKDGERAYGEKYKRLTYAGVALDLFIATPPAQYGVLQAIRTGPASFSKRLVTREPEGYLPFGLYVFDGALYHGRIKIETPDERDVFRAIALDYLEPWERR